MYAYADTTCSLGYGATMSSPTLHALTLARMINKLTPGAKVLDVGCGGGYLTAALYELVRDINNIGRTAVVGIEHIDSLVDLTVRNLRKSHRGEL